MRLKLINLLILIFISTPALADSEINKTIQKYLNALGYNLGPVDEILGKNSKKNYQLRYLTIATPTMIIQTKAKLRF